MAFVSELWYGAGIASQSARALLTPASWLFSAVVARRNRGYERNLPRRTALPALSVGNLTVGGTGKTPVAAWCTERLRKLGAHPAVVLRGYGDDEWRVHALLNPGVPVIVSPDRVSAIITAQTKGADVAVLDDAFQHRRAARVADFVLVSADRWTEHVRLLPAGPYREPLSSLSRASVAIITVKSATDEMVQRVTDAVGRAAPDVPIAVIRLRPGTLRLAATLNAAATDSSRAVRKSRDTTGMLSHPPEWLAGRAVVAASAVGDPDAFEAQLRALGADIRHAVRFADHYAYSDADAARIAALAATAAGGVVCTLKDAVKLQGVWPREAPPLWYVSQSVVVDRGAEALDRAFARVLAARTATALTAG
ncbi:MAG: tetraacyldisaccharide 4'-kinase [Gemmatimonadota bacterium]